MSELVKSLIELIQNIIYLFVSSIPLLCIVGIIVVIYLVRLKKYKESTYFKITNIPYNIVRNDTGKYGEYLIYKYLKSYETLGAKFLFNIYVPKKDEETTEIDVLMISRKGLFVFESKNYSGWIFGNDGQRYWYQTLPSGRNRSHKEKFYNPIFQNDTHVKYINQLLNENIPIHSIIVFSERCTLKNINIKSNDKVNVIKRNQVCFLISQLYNNVNDTLTDEKVEEIYNILYPYTQVENSIKEKHIMDVNEKKGNISAKIQDNVINDLKNNDNHLKLEDVSEQTINDDINIVKTGEFICPKCGSPLLLRKANRGEHVGEEFYGCSNYPKCKYIKLKKSGE